MENKIFAYYDETFDLILPITDSRIYLFSSLAARVFNKLTC